MLGPTKYPLLEFLSIEPTQRLASITRALSPSVYRRRYPGGAACIGSPRHPGAQEHVPIPVFGR